MAYSAKKRWVVTGSALALWFIGMVVGILLTRNHTDPVSIGLFRATLGFILVGLWMRAIFYMDEVQRQIVQKRWFWGSVISIAAMGPAVVFLQTQRIWLDAAVQFIFRHPAMPPLYFSLGVLIPVSFQVVSVLVLSLLDKLSRISRS